ncbi:MAG: hypothetical protein JWN03_4308 [Nocardia sp.]|uniref:sulfotransferase n=1 Tax=Nocardia sp. TaxID=1821 RepID=UPI00261591DE|nr:sulfotransferase [Nocardia sp.]MCU1644033.1 hypothetical protein [Nocardia sp.]
MPRTELSGERLSHEAILSAGGLSDFGGRAYEDGLNHLVTAVNATGESLLPAGYDAARGMIVDALRNRLLLRDNAERHPQICQIPVSAPVFILGLPRSGTTLLHNLLALHPQLRAPRPVPSQ